MKKIFSLLVSTLVVIIAFAQSQRMVLIEEFTQASCGPCAAANPAFNTLLDANPTKVVAIKYQTNWPGSDPMNVQTQSMVLPRVNYYGVSGVPYVRIDGLIPAPTKGTAPQDVTQQKIDLAYANPANYDISMYHYFSANNDSVFIYCDITCTKTFTSAGTLIAHIGLTEEEITFASAPGNNGETVFHDVMRAMYPNGSGTTLPANMNTLGQKYSIVVAKPLPSYIYDKSQLRVVSFIQETGNKMVHQAAYSSAPAKPDASVSAITPPNGGVCGSTTIDIPFTVKNTGSAPLSSLQVRYSIDNGPSAQLASTGITPAAQLSVGLTKSLTIPGISVAPGHHTIKIYTTAPNGGLDATAANDTLVSTFIMTPPSIGAPFRYDFTDTTVLDPAFFVVNNPASTSATWSYSSYGSYNAGSSVIPFFNLAPGSMQELYLPPYNLIGTTAPLYLTFDLAHAPYLYLNNLLSDDTLSLMATKDCGLTWSTIWKKTGNTGLGTTAPTAAQFTPTAQKQWRSESVDLTSFIESSLTLKFVGRSAYGNDAFIDNLNVSASATAIDKAVNSTNFSVAPNPFTGSTTMYFNLETNADVRVTMFNVMGETVLNQHIGMMASGSQSMVLDVPAVAAGVYYVQLSAGDHVATQKVSILK